MNKNISIAILAGGQSKRMGRNKALLQIGETSFIERTIDLITPRSEDCYVITKSKNLLNTLSIPVYTDQIQQQSPLAGIHAALHFAKHASCLVLACDMPFISTQLLTQLFQLHKPGHITGVKSEFGYEPLCAIYPQKVVSVIPELLKKSAPASALFKEAPFIEFDISNDEKLSAAIRNINTPEEYIRFVKTKA